MTEWAEATTRREVSLDDVRTRFLAAEEQLVQATNALNELKTAIETLGEAKAGLKEAGVEVARMGGLFQHSLDVMGQTLVTLRDGVEAIKRGEPGRLLGEVVDVKQAVHAGQSEILARVASGFSSMHDATAGVRHEVGKSADYLGRTVIAVDARVQRIESVLQVGDGAQAKRHASLVSELARSRNEVRVGLFAVALLGVAVVAAVLMR